MYTATTEIYTYVHTLSLRDALPYSRVKVVSDRDWIVTRDVSADEYYSSEQVKRALVRYPIKVVRLDIDPEHNPFGLALDCYAGAPQRIEPPPTPTQAGAPATAPGHLQGDRSDERCVGNDGVRTGHSRWSPLP